VKIKRIYDPVSKDDGRRILIDRLWPRGIKKEEAEIDEWLKEIAPSDELRRWFGHDPSKWQEFRKRYMKELKEKTDILERLRKEANKGRLTLLFTARDKEHCNAVVLQEVLAK
jgi:uncharacterized protein YeaO (DUF488 family)